MARNFIQIVWNIGDDQLMPKDHISKGAEVLVLEEDFEQPDKMRLRIAYPDQ